MRDLVVVDYKFVEDANHEEAMSYFLNEEVHMSRGDFLSSYEKEH